jgi:hypothetical protein
MAEIPESLLRRSAEAKAKALGLPVEQVLAEMRGEKPPAPPVTEEPAPPPVAEEVPADLPPEEQVVTEEAESLSPGAESEVPESAAPADASPEEVPVVEGEPAEQEEERELVTVGAPPEPTGDVATAPSVEATSTAPPEAEPDAPAPVETPPNGNGRRASLVSTRPVVPATGTPEGVRTQRLLTVVKARAIQQVKTEPTDKVNTWPHLMLAEFSALLAVTGVLVILSIILQAPLLDPANFNATPNPSKAPWYFLGLQELLSYFDPQIAGVTVPTIVGLIGFMAIPYVDRNPSTKPSDRKFAVMLYTLFMAGSATLTIFGVLFRGLGFNFAYPWNDGVFFDDIKDWVSFE